jgi:hypothetical protein
MVTLYVYLEYIKILHKIFTKYIMPILQVYPNYFIILLKIITNDIYNLQSSYKIWHNNIASKISLS